MLAIWSNCLRLSMRQSITLLLVIPGMPRSTGKKHSTKLGHLQNSKKRAGSVNCTLNLKFVPLLMGAVLGSLNVSLIWRCNHGIFYHCFFLAFWPVSGRRIHFHSFPFSGISSDWRQAFLLFVVACYALLISAPMGLSYRGFFLPSRGLFCPCLYPYIPDL